MAALAFVSPLVRVAGAPFSTNTEAPATILDSAGLTCSRYEYDGCQFGFAGLPVSVCLWCYLRYLDPNSKASCEGPVRKELIYDIIDFRPKKVAKLDFRPQK